MAGLCLHVVPESPEGASLATWTGLGDSWRRTQLEGSGRLGAQCTVDVRVYSRVYNGR